MIRVNKRVSEGINKAADNIDKSLSPSGEEDEILNRTRVFFTVGADFDDRGDIESTFRFGAQLHLPRFERYWKLKFANQDEKKDRGQSSLVRERRRRGTTSDDVFLGVNFGGQWKRIDVQYEPKLSFDDSPGIDHSIEAFTKYEFKKFSIEPSLEFFANHNEGSGSSGAIKFNYQFTNKLALQQGNDARYPFLSHELSVNHSITLYYKASNRLDLALGYFRSFDNFDGYHLAAYGGQFSSKYMIYKNILHFELTPYIVHEREFNFDETYGVIVNFHVNF